MTGMGMQAEIIKNASKWRDGPATRARAAKKNWDLYCRSPRRRELERYVCYFYFTVLMAKVAQLDIEYDFIRGMLVKCHAKTSEAPNFVLLEV